MNKHQQLVKRLARLARRRKWTMEVIADRIGCSVPAWVKWRAGKHTPLEIYRNRMREIMREEGQ